MTDKKLRLSSPNSFCGAGGWAMTPSGLRGVLNDAVSIYFTDAALAGAFVALVHRLLMRPRYWAIKGSMMSARIDLVC